MVISTLLQMGLMWLSGFFFGKAYFKASKTGRLTQAESKEFDLICKKLTRYEGVLSLMCHMKLSGRLKADADCVKLTLDYLEAYPEAPIKDEV